MLRSLRSLPELTHPFVARSVSKFHQRRAGSPMSSSVPIPKAPPQEVNIGFAAHLLRIESYEVVRLCKTGVLRARCNRHGTWRIDEVFLIQWHSANPNYGDEDRLLAGGEEQRALPCPAGACEAHWERRGRVVPAFRANLCQRCYSGRPLPLKADAAASPD